MALLHMEKRADKCTDRVQARGCLLQWPAGRLARQAEDSSLCACAIAARRLQPGPAPPLPRPGRPRGALWDTNKVPPKQAGVKRAATAAPARTRAAAAPSQPPLPSPRSLFPPFPTPPRRASASRRPPARPRQPPPTAARAPRAGPLAPPLRPTGARGRSLAPLLLLLLLLAPRALTPRGHAGEPRRHARPVPGCTLA